jgi:menaquinone-dependent protoporphyrinogen IX oxidase
MAMTATTPKVLFVYYTYSQQTLSVVEAMAAVLRDRGCEVRQAKIEFTDPRYADRFSRFPFRHVYLDLFAMLPAQLRRATGQIGIPEVAKEGGYDFVCIGSPTWWLTTCMPVRSFMKSDMARQLLAGKPVAAFAVCRRYWRNNLNTVKDLGIKHGGEFVAGAHFTHAGGQILSLLSLLSYLGKGENRDRYLGVRIPSADLKPEYVGQAQAFANGLAKRLGCDDRR